MNVKSTTKPCSTHRKASLYLSVSSWTDEKLPMVFWSSTSWEQLWIAALNLTKVGKRVWNLNATRRCPFSWLRSQQSHACKWHGDKFQPTGQTTLPSVSSNAAKVVWLCMIYAPLSLERYDSPRSYSCWQKPEGWWDPSEPSGVDSALHWLSLSLTPMFLFLQLIQVWPG